MIGPTVGSTKLGTMIYTKVMVSNGYCNQCGEEGDLQEQGSDLQYIAQVLSSRIARHYFPDAAGYDALGFDDKSKFDEYFHTGQACSQCTIEPEECYGYSKLV